MDIVGVVCDPAEAVVRGFRRTLATSEVFRSSLNLRSHRLFATHVSSGGFLPLVDRMAVYNTTHTRDQALVLSTTISEWQLHRALPQSVDEGSTVLRTRHVSWFDDS